MNFPCMLEAVGLILSTETKQNEPPPLQNAKTSDKQKPTISHMKKEVCFGNILLAFSKQN